jgi:hypothetical protein
MTQCTRDALSITVAMSAKTRNVTVTGFVAFSGLFVCMIVYYYEQLVADCNNKNNPSFDVTAGIPKIIFDPARLRHGAADRDGDYHEPSLMGKIIETEVVVFIPSPVAWEDRRMHVYQQFVRERLAPEQAVLLFIFGNRSGGEGLPGTVDMRGLIQHQNTTNVVVNCRDYGDDEPNNPDDSSGTTCKAYKALIYIVSNYRAKYVWRGADDSYLNLRFFLSSLMPTLPKSRLYYGYLRSVNTVQTDMLLSNHPKLASLLGLYQFGQYMLGGGYMVSFDVADFIASLKIPPHLTWCEDVMFGMWLNPFQVTFLHSPYYIDQHGGTAPYDVDYVLIHRMRADQWVHIDENGRLQAPTSTPPPPPRTG